MPVHRLARWSLAAAVATVAAAPARAADAPGARDDVPTVAKLDGPFVDAIVGSWDVVTQVVEGAESKGFARFRRAAGGTAVVRETERGTGDHATWSLEVMRLEAPGRVRMWSFAAGQVVEATGSLGADGWEFSPTPLTVWRLRRTGTGLRGSVIRRGTTVSTSTFTKSASTADFQAPRAPSDANRTDMVGEWDVAGAWTLPGEDGVPAPVKAAGTSSFRWALGGVAMLHEYEMTMPGRTVAALGVHRWPTDGKWTEVWWFEEETVAPQLAHGPVTEAGWTGNATMPDGAPMVLRWGRKGDGFEMTFETGGRPAGSETYSKKKL